MRSTTPRVEIADDSIKISIPERGRDGRGAIAYILYMLDPRETWLSVGATLGVHDRVAWTSARRYARERSFHWPPRPSRVEKTKTKRAPKGS